MKIINCSPKENNTNNLAPCNTFKEKVIKKSTELVLFMTMMI